MCEEERESKREKRPTKTLSLSGALPLVLSLSRLFFCFSCDSIFASFFCVLSRFLSLYRAIYYILYMSMYIVSTRVHVHRTCVQGTGYIYVVRCIHIYIDRFFRSTRCALSLSVPKESSFLLLPSSQLLPLNSSFPFKRSQIEQRSTYNFSVYRQG